jgi:hypothetical protein
MAIEAPASLLEKAARPFDEKTKAKACRRKRLATTLEASERVILSNFG